MPVLTTYVTLGILMVALVLLRIVWSRLPARLHSALFLSAAIVIALIVLSYVFKWSFVIHRLNSLLLLCGIASYGIMLLRFSLLSPRWLTSITALILFLPVFSSSVVLPVVDAFGHPVATETVPLGDRLFSVRSFVDRRPVAPSASDLDIYYRLHWLPFLQHRAAGVRFFDTQCVASASYAVLQPNRRSVMMVCPDSPLEPGDSTATVGFVVPLR